MPNSIMKINKPRKECKNINFTKLNLTMANFYVQRDKQVFFSIFWLKCAYGQCEEYTNKQTKIRRNFVRCHQMWMLSRILSKYGSHEPMSSQSAFIDDIWLSRSFSLCSPNAMPASFSAHKQCHDSILKQLRRTELCVLLSQIGVARTMGQAIRQ